MEEKKSNRHLISQGDQYLEYLMSLEFKKIFDDINQNMSELNLNLQKIQFGFGECFKLWENLVNDVSYSLTKSPYAFHHRLGELNWVLPTKICDIPRDLLDSNTLSDDIVTLYMRDNAKIFNRVVSDIHDRLSTEFQKKVFSESILTFNAKLYHCCCISLSPLIESLLIDQNNVMKTKINKMFQNTYQKVFHIEIADPNALLLLSLRGFIENYSAHKMFSEAEPAHLNRHWLLHGRMTEHLTKYHCLQLFGALWGLTELTHYLEDEAGTVDDVGINVGINERQVLEEISKNPLATAKNISQNAGITDRQVERILSQLKEKGVIRRVGSKKTGHWEVVLEGDLHE
ncbi:winged helix-turn-helix domain-containing protein [Methanorbis furvi]|uniref:Uncharacterized protein n=1 Tax=Methanorbis furvi TaxID=3028299 RepID=A0AAE4MAT2_9EURY|nr:hypothetical protein [Methanocorpusculaceae archaeon Ag1]